MCTVPKIDNKNFAEAVGCSAQIYLKISDQRKSINFMIYLFYQSSMSISW